MLLVGCHAFFRAWNSQTHSQKIRWEISGFAVAADPQGRHLTYFSNLFPIRQMISHYRSEMWWKNSHKQASKWRQRCFTQANTLVGSRQSHCSHFIFIFTFGSHFHVCGSLPSRVFVRGGRYGAVEVWNWIKSLEMSRRQTKIDWHLGISNRDPFAFLKKSSQSTTPKHKAPVWQWNQCLFVKRVEGRFCTW